jgi:hypothetical protein
MHIMTMRSGLVGDGNWWLRRDSRPGQFGLILLPVSAIHQPRHRSWSSGLQTCNRAGPMY